MEKYDLVESEPKLSSESVTPSVVLKSGERYF